MNFNAIIDSMDGNVASTGQSMLAAMALAAQTGEPTDYLKAQREMATFNILVSFESGAIKFSHDSIASILQKM
ncbi:EscF/YscF/HrpA family type III secretion system needle major subunit [Cupriavidus respiraculi]|uniref:Uncharacterized protein n=1 Tax=Cupriavidus respiraculi TaxID=195930 RepID=A0ABN7Y2V7_9BURK|nr:EscF/YscF/HrpA family type III secretion system needle major subunit [Cupriavidus respiraculi]MBY4948232.1 EscF/YscF/HrpA family type III secretion system needle major subunit [Cupriavidus respiraculi]CAG9167642.1 hypothetical protein LMG21510_00804 [Cupriavidus respiraculi]